MAAQGQPRRPLRSFGSRRPSKPPVLCKSTRDKSQGRHFLEEDRGGAGQLADPSAPHDPAEGTRAHPALGRSAPEKASSLETEVRAAWREVDRPRAPRPISLFTFAARKQSHVPARPPPPGSGCLNAGAFQNEATDREPSGKVERKPSPDLQVRRGLAWAVLTDLYEMSSDRPHIQHVEIPSQGSRGQRQAGPATGPEQGLDSSLHPRPAPASPGDRKPWRAGCFKARGSARC